MKKFSINFIFVILITSVIFGFGSLVSNARTHCKQSTFTEEDYRYCIGI